MNRSLIIAVLIAVVGGGYYFYSQGKGGGEMMDAATDAVSGAADTVSGAAADATEAVTEAATGAMDGAMFSAEGYDAVKVAEMIEASSMDENQKNGLKTALLAAADDPALLTSILAQVKEALGM